MNTRRQRRTSIEATNKREYYYGYMAIGCFWCIQFNKCAHTMLRFQSPKLSFIYWKICILKCTENTTKYCIRMWKRCRVLDHRIYWATTSHIRRTKQQFYTPSVSSIQTSEYSHWIWPCIDNRQLNR